MKQGLFIIIAFISSFQADLLGQRLESPKSSTNKKARGIYLDTSEKLKGQYSIKLNSKDTFKSAKINDMVTFLVGNNQYKQGAITNGFAPLEQCVNDTRLLSRIFSVCCHVPLKNIVVGNNLTANEFRRMFRMVIANLKKNQSLLFSYSGHGDSDGSLVFCEGGKISPSELKRIVNSCQNDTTILLDACYSGNNEGPLDRKEKIQYKENSVRIYASLAHMTAKEISYQGHFVSEFFSGLNIFHKNVLGINNLSGNGYFTSFIGYFFATYKFRKDENISINNMLNFISNKGKQYVEYLAMRGNANRSATTESRLRLDQQPKMFPISSQVRYHDPNHKFLLIHKYIKPSSLSLDFFTAPVYSLNTIFRDKISGAVTLRFIYEPISLNGFFFGLETGYMYTSRDENKTVGDQGIDLKMVPIFALAGYRFPLWNSKLSLKVEVGTGMIINTWNFHSYSIGESVILYPESRNTFNFGFLAGFGVAWDISENLSFSINFQTVVTYFGKDESYNMFRIPISFNYKL